MPDPQAISSCNSRWPAWTGPRYLIAGESIRFFTKYFNENPGAPHGFPISELQILEFFPVNGPSSVFLNAYGGTSYGYKTGIPPFDLGGVTRFVAFGTNELLTDQYFLFQTGYIRKLKTLPPLLGSTIDALFMFEIGKTYPLPLPEPPNLPGDVAGALIVNTIFGPVEVGGAVGQLRSRQILFPDWESLLKTNVVTSRIGQASPASWLPTVDARVSSLQMRRRDNILNQLGCQLFSPFPHERVEVARCTGVDYLHRAGEQTKTPQELALFPVAGHCSHKLA